MIDTELESLASPETAVGDLSGLHRPRHFNNSKGIDCFNDSESSKNAGVVDVPFET